jgi:hypothetical protein
MLRIFLVMHANRYSSPFLSGRIRKMLRDNRRQDQSRFCGKGYPEKTTPEAQRSGKGGSRNKHSQKPQPPTRRWVPWIF